MKKIHALIMGLAACAATQAGASGFQSMEQNASGLGTAYAGSAAVADNASTIYYNPAGLTRLPGYQVSVGVVGVMQDYDFDDDGSFGATGGNGGSAGKWRALPNAYMSWAVNSDWVVGLGISSPNSQHLEYDNDWRGRNFAVESRVRSLNLNPSVAYKLSDKVSLGFGLNYQKLKADSRYVDVTSGAMQNLSGDDSDWGWNAGALFTLSPAMRVGVAYRSGMKFDLDRNLSMPGVNGSGRFKTPGSFTLSVWQQVSDRWEAMGDLSYTQWKSLSGYEHNSWRLAWGAAYKYNDQWKSKFGLAYDRSPFRNGDRTAMLPDDHRVWLSIGGQYKLTKYGVLDFGYAYQWAVDPKVNQRVGGVGLKGDYDANGHVIGVQYTHSF